MKNKKLNVAIVYHYIANYRESIFSLLCLSENIIKYKLYAGEETDRKIKLLDKDSPIYLHKCVKVVKNYWFKGFLYQKSIISLSFDRDVDVIIYLGQYNILSTWFSAILSRLAGKRVLMWSHGFIREERNLKGFIRFLFYRISSGVLLYGHRAKNIMIDKGYNPDNIYVVYNSLDLKKQQEVRKAITSYGCEHKKSELFIDAKLPVLLFVGRLTPQKKLTLILEAVKILEDKGSFVNVLFVGDGEDLANLKAYTVSLGISERVVFYGSCFSEDALGLLISLSDLCVSPGEVGLTAMHSLVYGTPVITHNDPSKQGPEYEAIEDGVTGSFFNIGCKYDLADKIQTWLSTKTDKEQIKKDCMKVIDDKYNPNYQKYVIDAAVKNIPPKDLINQ